MAVQVGTITQDIINILGITYIKPDTPILLGDTNIKHHTLPIIKSMVVILQIYCVPLTMLV